MVKKLVFGIATAVVVGVAASVGHHRGYMDASAQAYEIIKEESLDRFLKIEEQKARRRTIYTMVEDLYAG